MRFLQYLLYLIYRLLGLEAVRLNLVVFRRPEPYEWHGVVYLHYPLRSNGMAKIGDKFVASIAPTNAAGKPAPVTDALFEELTALYDEVDVSADGFSVTFVAVLPGSGAFVSVTAKSKSGALLADNKALPDVDAPPVDDEAVALNLTITPA